MRWIKISKLRILQHGGREPDVIRNIVDEVRETGKWKIDPIVVIKLKGGWYALLDGWHRVRAAKKLKMKKINALVAPKRKMFDWIADNAETWFDVEDLEKLRQKGWL